MTSKRRVLTRPEAQALLDGLGASGAGQKVIDGVQFPEKLRWKAASVLGALFRDTDWRHALVGTAFFGRGNVADCRFEDVDFDGVDCRKVDFHRCAFESTTFGREHFGIFLRCTFTECTFANCRFDLVDLAESTFRSCRFERIRARRMRSQENLLEDVMLSGALDKVNFIDSTFRHVDMSGVDTTDCAIVGSKEDDFKLPDRPENFAVDAALFFAVEPQLRSRLDRQALDTYRSVAKSWSKMGSRFLVDASSFRELSPTDRDTVMSTLYEMRHSVTSSSTGS